MSFNVNGNYRMDTYIDEINVNSFEFSKEDIEKYSEHMDKRHKEEQEYMAVRKQEQNEYRSMMIADILDWSAYFTKEELINKSTEQLEKIYDHC